MGGRFPVGRWRAVTLGLGAALLLGIVIASLEAGGNRHRPRRAVPSGGAAFGPAGPPALAAPTAPLLGVSVERLFLDRTYSPAQIDAQLTALGRTGATDARCDTLWEATEPRPPAGASHRYDWSFDDQIAGALARHRLRWLPIIDYTVSWAQSLPGQDHSAPKFPLAYAAYAAAFVARYGPGGSFWQEHPTLRSEPVGTIEIWNEPDGGHFWLPGPSPRPYANLYADARAAVKAVTPDIRVIVGGLTNPLQFLPQMLGARPDLRGHIDGVGIHPYAPTPIATVDLLRSDRAALRTLGMPFVPLYVTEFGWTPRPRGAQDWLPARLRPGYITETISALPHTNCTIGGVFLYTWVTPQRDPANGFDWFGIHPPGGGHTGAEAAFAAGIRAAKQARPRLNVCG